MRRIAAAVRARGCRPEMARSARLGIIAGLPKTELETSALTIADLGRSVGDEFGQRQRFLICLLRFDLLLAHEQALAQLDDAFEDGGRPAAKARNLLTGYLSMLSDCLGQLAQLVANFGRAAHDLVGGLFDLVGGGEAKLINRLNGRIGEPEGIRVDRRIRRRARRLSVCLHAHSSLLCRAGTRTICLSVVWFMSPLPQPRIQNGSRYFVHYLKRIWQTVEECGFESNNG